MRRYALRDDQWDRIKDILPDYGDTLLNPYLTAQSCSSVRCRRNGGARGAKGRWQRFPDRAA